MSDKAELTLSTNEPLYLGGGALTQDYQGMPVSLDGRGFLLDLRAQSSSGIGTQKLFRRAVQLLNTQQAQSSGDQAQTPPEIWRRSTDSWVLGAGQSRQDRDGSQVQRFNDSQGVDCWTPWQLSLLRDTIKIQTLAAGTAVTVSFNSQVIVMTGTSGYWYDGTTVTPFTLSSAVVSADTDGTQVYVLMADGHVEKYTSAATHVSHMVAFGAGFDATRAFITVIKGLLIFGHKNTLNDITSGTLPTATPLKQTYPNPNLTFKTGTDGLNSGYIIGGSGDRWYIFSLTIDATTGANFTPPVVAATLPDGEIAYCVASYLGNVLIGTAKGIRLAVPASSASLTFGKLIQTEQAVRSFEGQDRFIWYGQSSDTNAGLGRTDLSKFTSSLTPSYANDLRCGVPGTVSGIATINGVSGFGYRVFVVEGQGIYRETDNCIPSGFLKQGAVAFGASDPKVGMYVQMFTRPLTGGVASISAIYDDGVEVPLGSIGTTSTVTMGNVPANQQFNTAELVYRLTRDPATFVNAPVVQRTEIRALVVPGRATEFQIPIVLRDTMEYDGTESGRDVVEDYDFLMGLVQSRRFFIYRERQRTWGLHATDFVWIPDKETGDLRTYQGTFTLTCKEIG